MQLCITFFDVHCIKILRLNQTTCLDMGGAVMELAAGSVIGCESVGDD